MKSRMIALAATLGLVSFAALPVAQAAAVSPSAHSAMEVRYDRTKDRAHPDRSRDLRGSRESSRDVRGR